MAARAVIKDVGRVMDLPYAMVDNIAKMIPQKVGVTIDSAMNGDADRDIKPNAEFKALYEADETVRDLIDKAKRLEGLPSMLQFTPQVFLSARRMLESMFRLQLEQIMSRLRSLKALLWSIWDC